MLIETKILYWPDTGPVEAHMSGSYIIRAQMVEAMQDSDNSDVEFVRVWRNSSDIDFVPVWESDD